MYNIIFLVFTPAGSTDLQEAWVFGVLFCYSQEVSFDHTWLYANMTEDGQRGEGCARKTKHINRKLDLSALPSRPPERGEGLEIEINQVANGKTPIKL